MQEDTKRYSMNTPENTSKKPENHVKVAEEKIEKEQDADTEVHKDGSDLIKKEDHHLEVDDEVKKG